MKRHLNHMWILTRSAPLSEELDSRDDKLSAFLKRPLVANLLMSSLLRLVWSIFASISWRNLVICPSRTDISFSNCVICRSLDLSSSSWKNNTNHIKNNMITARKRSLGQGNTFSSVCQEFCSQGGGSTWADTPPGQVPPPMQVHPPGRYTPPGQDPPPQQVHLPGQVHPLSRYTQLVRNPPSRYTPQSSTCWEIWATSGRYASYWNAFLFLLNAEV